MSPRSSPSRRLQNSRNYDEGSGTIRGLMLPIIITRTLRTKVCKQCRRKFCPHIVSIALLLASELDKGPRSVYMNETHAAHVQMRFIAFDGYMKDRDEPMFHEYTRLKFSEFEELHNRLKERLSHIQSHRFPIDTVHRLAICLRYLGHGRSFHSLGHEFRLGRSTVTAIVYEVCRAIIAEFWKEAFPNPTAATWLESAEGFSALWNYPRAVGAIDGKHFRVVAPMNTGSAHYNYKGFFSIVLLAVVDSTYRMIMVDCGGKGRISDSGLFRTSPIKDLLEKSRRNFPPPAPLGHHGIVEYHILADGGFPQSVWMQRPFLQMEAFRDSKKTHFNECFSSARRVVESVFGILTARFRVFQGPLQGSPEHMKLIIIASCVLHNLLARKIPRDELLARYPHSSASDTSTVTRPSRVQVQDDAHAQRLRLAEYFADRDGQAEGN